MAQTSSINMPSMVVIVGRASCRQKSVMFFVYLSVCHALESRSL